MSFITSLKIKNGTMMRDEDLYHELLSNTDFIDIFSDEKKSAVKNIVLFGILLLGCILTGIWDKSVFMFVLAFFLVALITVYILTVFMYEPYDLRTSVITDKTMQFDPSMSRRREYNQDKGIKRFFTPVKDHSFLSYTTECGDCYDYYGKVYGSDRNYPLQTQVIIFKKNGEKYILPLITPITAPSTQEDENPSCESIWQEKQKYLNEKGKTNESETVH